MYMQSGHHAIATCLFCRRCPPHRIPHTMSGMQRPPRSPKMVKHQPTPTPSMTYSRTASAAAARAQRTRLADAAAVEALSAFRSVRSVPNA